MPWIEDSEETNTGDAQDEEPGEEPGGDHTSPGRP